MKTTPSAPGTTPAKKSAPAKSTSAPTANKTTASKTAATKTTANKTTTRKTAAELTESLRVKDDESPWSEAEIREVHDVLVGEIETHRVELQQAEDELGDLFRAAADGAGDDQADAGAKTAEQVHEFALAANARASLVQAEHALEQLLAGTYGICENCGNPIGKLRLQARPRATLCMTCQAKQDRH